MQKRTLVKIGEGQAWYTRLLADIKKLEFAGIVVAKWSIGKRILKDLEKFGRPEYGDKQIENIAIDLDIPKRELYLCMQFAKKCDAVAQLADKSWRYIVHELLPEHKEKDETPALPEGKYQVIYADPPWFYAQEQHSEREQATVLNTHYPPMQTGDICELQVGDLATKNSVLFLWVTSPKLYEAKQVIDAWGFQYKASMVWDKVKHNVGYYVSVRHEFLLICTKGSCLPDGEKLHDSVVTVERTHHSEKPGVFYEIIEDMYHGKKIELFARKKRAGWDSWGNEI